MIDRSSLPDPASAEWNGLWNKAARLGFRRYLRMPTEEEMYEIYAKLVRGEELESPMDPLSVVEPARITVPQFSLPNGLNLRHILASELDAVLHSLETADSTPLADDESRSQTLARWYSNPRCWFLVLEHYDRALQYEVLELNPETKQAFVHFNAHVDGERPGRFWRECARPMFEWLHANGYTLMSQVALPSWRAKLQERYVVTVENNRVVYDMAGSLAKMTGWPPRPTVPGWNWHSHGVKVVEMTREEVLPLMAEVWAKRHNPSTWKNRDESLRILNERWELDSAAVLGGFFNDEFVSAVVMVDRANGMCGQATITPYVAKGMISGPIQLGFTTWAHEAGYTHLMAWYPYFKLDLVAQGKQRLPWRIVRRYDKAEGQTALCQVNIAEALAMDPAHWFRDLEEL